ncbi:hypothetical protein UT300012_22690 [Paraclostridium bifermentans]
MLIDKLNNIRNKYTTVIDERGGTGLLRDLECLIESIYSDNPYVELIVVDLSSLEEIDTVRNKLQLYVANMYKKNIDSVEVIGDYLKYKIEMQGLYCVYDRVNNKLKIKR